MATVMGLVKRHPVLTYFALVFAISWGGILLILGGDLHQASEEEIGRLMGVLYLLMMAGPSAAGILLISLLHGRSGWRDFFARLLQWRVGLSWYAAALLTAPVVATAALLTLSLFSSDFLPRIYTADDKAFVLQFGIVSGLMVGIMEEIGWTGFAIPTLRRRHGVLATGLIVGLAIGVWHMPLVYWTSIGTTGDLPPLLYLLAVNLTWLPTYRVLMVWVYDHTESLLVAMIMHTSLITFWYILTPLVLTGTSMAVYFILFSAGLWLVIGAIALASGRRLEGQPLQRGAA